MPDDQLQDGVDRLVSAIERAINAKTPPRDDWHEAAFDLLSDLEEAIRHGNEGRAADAAMYARLAVGNLAGIWLSVDEGDAAYLGKDPADV